MSALRGPEHEAQLGRGHYFSAEYHRAEQLYSLVEQFRVCADCQPQTVLEIGPGSGYVTALLRQSGVEVETVDVNAELNPTYVCPIADLETGLKGKMYDLVLCGEVLEHIPFEEFAASVAALAARASRHVVITLPRYDTGVFFFRAGMRVRRSGPSFFSGVLPLKIKRKIFQGHFWEINDKPEHSLAAIRAVMAKHGQVSDFRFPLNPYHHFFVIAKNP